MLGLKQRTTNLKRAISNIKVRYCFEKWSDLSGDWICLFEISLVLSYLKCWSEAYMKLLKNEYEVLPSEQRTPAHLVLYLCVMPVCAGTQEETEKIFKPSFRHIFESGFQRRWFREDKRVCTKISTCIFTCLGWSKGKIVAEVMDIFDSWQNPTIISKTM